METIKGIQRKNLFLVVFFWVVGGSWVLLNKLESIDNYLSFPQVMGLMVGIAAILLALLIFAILLLLKGVKDARKHNPYYTFINFLFSELRVTEEFEDERTTKISQKASLRSSAYTEAFISFLLFLLIITGGKQVSTEILLLLGLLAISIKQLSYIYVWRKEYFR